MLLTWLLHSWHRPVAPARSWPHSTRGQRGQRGHLRCHHHPKARIPCSECHPGNQSDGNTTQGFGSVRAAPKPKPPEEGEVGALTVAALTRTGSTATLTGQRSGGKRRSLSCSAASPASNPDFNSNISSGVINKPCSEQHTAASSSRTPAPGTGAARKRSLYGAALEPLHKPLTH